MPVQTYRCPEDGDFEVQVEIKAKVPGSVKCPKCNCYCPWLPPTGMRFTMR